MLDKILLDAAAKMGIAMTAAQARAFETYHGLLLEANAKFNLTRVSPDLQEAADRNYLDCIAPLAQDWPDEMQNLVDVGSGAGFPGIPLSIMLPDVHIVLVDALEKRVRFLQSVIDALGLNAEALHLRAEDAAKRPELREQFDCAAARAVAPMNVLSEYLLPFVRVGGRMLAFKGPSAAEELEEAEFALSELGGSSGRIVPVSIPGRDWSHNLIYVEKVASTPQKYPRKAGLPEKKPLNRAKK